MATEATPIRRLEAIVLAAGSGSRFGGRKLLAPFAGHPLIEGALGAALGGPVRSVTLVTGADSEAVAEAARQAVTRLGQSARLRIVHAEDHAEGMGASLRTGVGALPADAEGVFVLLGDMPRTPAGLLDRLAAALAAGAPAAAPQFQGRRGNPALIGRALFPDLLALTGDRGARAILDRLGPDLAIVEAPDGGVLFDVDRPQDLAR